MSILRSIASLSLAVLLGSGAALAQNVPANDPSNKANPPSTLNKDRTLPADADRARDVEQAEKGNPHSVKNNDQSGGMGHEDMMADATPQMILQKLHLTDLKEIDAGKLAERNGTAKVQDYARMLQTDHQDADRKVTDLAKKKGFTLSDTPMKPEKQQRMQMEKDTLSSLKGAEFDKTFAGMMAQGHRHLIEMAKGWTSNCKDQDVCALIDTLMPKLQQHLQMAEKLRGPLPQGRAP
jgi:putative membrane protein